MDFLKSQMLDQVLNNLPYPVGKEQLLQLAKQFGANDQVVGLLNNLPDQTFHSAQEIRDAAANIGGLGNIGGMLGNLGNIFKR